MKKVLILFAVPLLCACHKEVVDEDSAQVSALYSDLCGTYRAYTDSLTVACDSASLSGVEDALETALVKVYERYPADLDRKLSQAQNDSLWVLTTRYMKLRTEKHTPPPAAPDSI